MYVNTADALSFTKLEEAFGIPSTTSGMIELFGQYCGPDHWCFWAHDPDAKLWKRHEIIDRTPEFAGITREEQERFRQVFQELSELAAPPMPRNISVICRGKPFLYTSFMFQWIFIPELGRWEILPLGRYDPMATQH